MLSRNKKLIRPSTGYYGIEDPFPDLISKLCRFMGGYGVPVVNVGCQEPLVVRMLRKLWRIIVHGGIDGFSRIPVYLVASSNNRSCTVLGHFLVAVEK